MKRLSYGERDYTFGQAMLSLRTAIGLTQVALAERLGITRKAIGRWEAGETYPSISHVKALLELAAGQRAFAAGREEEEIRAFWKAAHQKVSLDEQWLQELLDQQRPQLELVSRRWDEQVVARSEVGPRLDWDEALAVPNFYGRTQEVGMLHQWVVQERCRVVSVLGLGGIGKSALAIHLMHLVASHFEVVIWRSLRDAPTCEALLDDCLQVLAPRLLHTVSTSLEQRLDLLLKHLRHSRILFVLDNLEALLEEGQGTGQMRIGYESYTRLLLRVAETEHQSCLLLTSREKPNDLISLEGSRKPVRALRLSQLDDAACQQLLTQKDVTGSPDDYARLIEAYAGNPLALNIVAQTIVDLFTGEIAPFLQQGEVIYGGIRDLLARQFARLSPLEQTMLLWLAILREPVSLEQLQAVLVTPFSRAQLLEAIEALHHRSLIERGQRPGSFTLQSVVLEYAIERLIVEAASEIERGQLVRLIEHGLELATVKEYVRQTQKRVLVIPLLIRVQAVSSGRMVVEERLLALLDEMRRQADDTQGYGSTNIVALLRELRGHLRGLNLSQLTIRGAALQGIEMQDTTLAETILRDTTFTEALDATRTVAISPDGRYWAAGSWQGIVRVWQQEGKSLHLTLQAHTSTVSSLAFSPDGRMLATGSWDGALKLWNVESGTLLWTSWRTNNIQTLAFAPDGHIIASAGNDATVRLWNAHHGTYLQSLSGQNGAVYALAWSPDGRLLVSGGLDGGVRMWEMRGVQPESFAKVFTGHTGWVFALAFAPAGDTLASGSFDRTVKLWDIEEEGGLRVRQTLVGHTDKVRAVSWSPDGHILVSCGFDQTTLLWDVERGDHRLTLQGHTAAVHGLAFTPDSRSLLTGSDDGTLRVWDVANGQCVSILQGYAVSLYDVAWSPDGTLLASAGSNNLVSIWEVGGRKSPRQLHGHRWIVHGVAWSPNGRLLASCGWDNAIRLWDVSTGEAQQVLGDSDHVDTFFYGVTWSPDGRFVASGSYQGGVYVWEATRGTRRWVGRTPSAIIRRIEWSPDGTLLANCSDDGSIYLWDASDGRLRASFQKHGSMVKCLAWSPDSVWLASAGGNQGRGEIVVWNVESERQYSLSGQGEITYALAWDLSGGMLVSGGGDGDLRWWDVQRGECLRVREAHRGTVQSLKVSPDGSQLASCGDDGTIMLWNLHRGEHLRTLWRERPYERLNITGIRGLSAAKKSTLRTLGAIEDVAVPGLQRAPEHRQR